MKNFKITKGGLAHFAVSAFMLLALVLVGVALTPADASAGAVEIVTATTPVVMMRDELVRKKINQLLIDLGIKPNSVVLAPSYLKSFVAITNNLSMYKFNLKNDQNILYPTVEQRLDRNDIFICHRMGYGIQGSLSGDIARQVWQTYPNQTTFPIVAGFVPTDLHQFWNAEMTLKVGNTTFIPSLDTRNFYYAPQTQKSAATNYDYVDGQQDGFLDMSPQLLLSGSANIELNVEVPLIAAAQVASVTANLTYNLGVWLRGFIIKEANPEVTAVITKRLMGGN